MECLSQLASLNPKDQNSQGTCASHGHPSPSCHDFRTLSDCQLRNAQSQTGLWQSKSKRWLGNNGPHRCARIQDLASVRPTQLEQILEQVPRTMLLIDLPIDQSVIHPSLPLSLPPSIHPQYLQHILFDRYNLGSSQLRQRDIWSSCDGAPPGTCLTNAIFSQDNR